MFQLTNAVKSGNLKEVVYLLDNKTLDIEIDPTNCLLYAAEREYLPILKTLISHGANVSSYGALLLRQPIINGYLDIVQELLKHGACVTRKMLNMAADRGQLKIVKELLKYGVQPGIHTLKASLTKDHKDIVKELIFHGMQTEIIENLCFSRWNKYQGDKDILYTWWIYLPPWSIKTHKFYPTKFKSEVNIWLLVSRRLGTNILSKDMKFYIIKVLALLWLQNE